MAFELTKTTDSGAKRWIYRILLIAIPAISFSFAVVVPPFQGNDEHGHFVRAYEISRAHWIGSASPTLPQSIAGLIQRYPERLEDSGGAGVRFRAELALPHEPASEIPLSEAGSSHPYLAWGVVGANVYCPVVYLPAAAGIWMARQIFGTPLAQFYGARFANVIVFGLVVAIGFRLAPQARALMAAVALLPMTLFQSAVVSADAVVIPAAFLGFALILRSREHPVSRRLLAGLAVFFPLWVVCKLSPWIFAVVFLIGHAGFSSRKARAWYLCLVIAGMILTTIGWQALSAANTEALRQSRQLHGIDIAANVRGAIHRPVGFFVQMAGAIAGNLPDHARQFWGVFGWSKFSGPWWLRALYLSLLLVVAVTEPLRTALSTVERRLAAAVFVCGVVLVYSILFLTDAHPCGSGAAAQLCFDNSAGVQGRYLIPFSFFGFLSLRLPRTTVPQWKLAAMVAIAGPLQAAVALTLIARRFY